MSDRERLTVALFVGDDVASYSLMNSAVRVLVSLDARVYIVHPIEKSAVGYTDGAWGAVNGSNHASLPYTSTPAEAGSPQALVLYRFWERQVLNEHVIPFLLRDPPISEVGLLPSRQLEQVFHPNVHTMRVRDLCDPSVLEMLHIRKVNCGIAIGCSERPRSPLISYFREAASGTRSPRLVNVHPGIFPEYQGVMSHFYAMVNGSPHSGYTLHQVTEEGDNGAVLGLRRSRLDYNRSLLWNSFALANEGAALITQYLHRLAHGTEITGIIETGHFSQIYSQPGEVELSEFQNAGCVTVQPEEDVLIYTQKILSGIPGSGSLATQLLRLAKRSVRQIEFGAIAFDKGRPLKAHER